jgi:putative hydrolase of the HAD superfamily
VRCFLNSIGVEAEENLVESLSGIEHQFLREKTYWYDDAITTLTRLRRSGIKLGLVTNASPSVWEVIRTKGICEVIDQLTISSEVRMAKPDTGIYQECLQRLGCSPARAAYVGDGNDRELDGAKIVGLFTILVKRQERVFTFAQSSEAATDVSIEDLSLLPPILSTGHATIYPFIARRHL